MDKENYEIEVTIEELKGHYETHFLTAKQFIDLVKEWHKSEVKKLTLTDVSQHRELLNSLADNFNESTHTYVGQPMIEETIKEFNCG